MQDVLKSFMPYTPVLEIPWSDVAVHALHRKVGSTASPLHRDMPGNEATSSPVHYIVISLGTRLHRP